MKNKKLFAILTLVCFMFTLMPVAAFAADTYTLEVEQSTATGNVTVTVLKNGSVDKTWDGSFFSANAGTPVTLGSNLYAGRIVSGVGVISAAEVVTDMVTNAGYAYAISTDGVADVTAYFVPSAEMIAYAKAKTNTNVDPGESTIATVKSNVEVDVAEYADVVVELDKVLSAAENVIVWAEKTNDVAAQSLAVVGATEVGNTGFFKITDATKTVFELKVGFTAAGTYKLHAAVVPAATVTTVEGGTAAFDIDAIDTELKTEAGYNTIVVEGANLDSSEFDMYVNSDDDAAYEAGPVADEAAKIKGLVNVAANGVNEQKIVLTFKDEDGANVVGYTVNIDTNSSAIEVSADKLTTNYKGEVEFYVSGTIEGTYEIYVECEDYDATIEVTVGSTAAAYIELDTQPAAPQALYGDLDNDDITFAIADINGNAFNGGEGIKGIVGNDGKDTQYKGKYIVLTEKPADSDLKSSDLSLVSLGNGEWGLDGVEKDAEGDYAVKVILDNGAYATAEWTVKKFDKPVRLIIGTSTDTVELGGRIGGALSYMDANGVMKDADDVDVAATGYAVAKVVNNANGDNASFNVTAKTDEKYVGATFTVTAVSEKYDLVATKEFKVAAGAAAVKYVGGNAEVNVNNKLEWNIVDETGTRVALGGAAVNNVSVDKIKYVVLDAPEGAKVSVNDKTVANDLTGKGIGQMALTSNKVGNVTVQIIVEATYHDVNDTTNKTEKQVKYYTGIAVVPVGTTGTGDVVVLSIGSHQIVKNDEVKDIPAAAVIKDSRTFVPFRALGEAFGANVVWDEPTQSVIAELNGVKVVLTIGSTSYTVNGVEKVADVAPYIDGASTMVPVRFIATAFGIEPIVTQNPDGTTADILFLL